jgi:hypothetical protein
MVSEFDRLLSIFDIGDLVRLVEDYNIDVGYGLVTDVKTNFDDVYDLEYLRARIGTLRDIIPARNDDFFPSKPQVLVLWSGKNLVGSNKSIWMYESELTLVQKAVK